MLAHASSLLRFAGSARALAAVGVSALLVGGHLTAGEPGASVGGAARTPLARQSVEIPYNGDFTFTRIRYGEGFGGFGRGRGGGNWAHDYPNADRNMEQILDEF